MPLESIKNDLSLETRRRIEEASAQAAYSATAPTTSSYTMPIASSHAVSSISTPPRAQSSPPIPVLQTQCPEALLKKMEAIKHTDPHKLESIDVLFFEILKILESQSKSAISTREILLTAYKEWQHSLEKELLQSGEKEKSAQSTSNTMTKISQALGPFSVIGTGLFAVATGCTTPLIPLAAAALSALFFIDSLFDDITKKTIASILSQGKSEETKTWFQRIRLFSNVLSMGLQFATSGPAAIQIASSVSQAALEGIKAGSERSRDTAQARLLELDSLFSLSKTNSTDLLEKWRQILAAVFERYKIFQAIQEAKNQTKQKLILSIH